MQFNPFTKRYDINVNGNVPTLFYNSLETLKFERTLTYGQIKGIKALLRLVKRLHPQTKLIDVAVNETNYGQPGSANTYRVRMRYKSDV